MLQYKERKRFDFYIDMKNIQTILPEHISEYIYNHIWTSDIFRAYHKKENSVVDILIQKISEAPIFFYELSHPKERIQLTSFVRCIAFREYINPYIQDLYYFHELVHMASYIAIENITFEQWCDNLNENELVASLHSEAFIYLCVPEILGKTFSNLWVERFLIQKSQCVQTLTPTFDIFDFKTPWPEEYQIYTDIIKARRKLRSVAACEILQNYDDQEKEILRYNRLRENWLPKWKPYYHMINPLLNQLIRKNISSQDYLNELLSTQHQLYPGVIFPSVIYSLP